MSKNTFAAATMAVLLAACSSTSLDPAPVGDRSAVNSPGQGGAGESRVAPVTAQQRAGDALGPIGASRLVYFDYDSYAIRPEFRQLLDSHAKYLRDNRTRKVVLEGHTDERGGREYNLALGQQRSEAVRRALALLGVPAGQVEAVSFGKEKPAAAGGDEAAWAKNRRAEIAYR